METAIYCRVSTEEQAQEGFSIRAQEQKLKDYARIKDWSIYKIYMDEGISGKNITDRPAIQEMIADVESGEVQNVLVFKIDRLTRSTSDLIYLTDLFNEKNCAFNSLTESIDTQTASGRMFLKIIGIFAEFERENIIERVKVGLERKVREGYTIGSQPSFGYDRPVNQKVQTINEKEAEIVREIFDLYANEGVKINDIARRLNARKIKTKQNSTWKNHSIRQLLSNSNYIGNVRHHMTDEKRGYSVEGRHEAIISEELFEGARRLLGNSKKVMPRKPPRDDNYFSGFLTCAKCNYKMVTHNIYRNLSDGTPVVTGSYRCQNKTYGTCNSTTISHRKLESAFEEYITKYADLDISDEMELETQKKQDNQAQIQAYENKLRQLEAREREAMKLYVVDGSMEFDGYREIKKLVDKEKSDIATELERLKAKENEIPVNNADVINNLRENWSLLSASERRQFLLENMAKMLILTEKENGGHYSTVKILDIEFLPSYEKKRTVEQRKNYSR